MTILTGEQMAAKARINAMLRAIEVATHAAMDAVAREAEAAGCLVAGPLDDLGDPRYNLAADLGAIGRAIHGQIGQAIGAVASWSPEGPDRTPGVTP